MYQYKKGRVALTDNLESAIYSAVSFSSLVGDDPTVLIVDTKSYLSHFVYNGKYWLKEGLVTGEISENGLVLQDGDQIDWDRTIDHIKEEKKLLMSGSRHILSS